MNQENHGTMRQVTREPYDRFNLYRCDICGREIMIRWKDGYRSIEKPGDEWATHSCIFIGGSDNTTLSITGFEVTPSVERDNTLAEFLRPEQEDPLLSPFEEWYRGYFDEG